jgi:hypothetical protein
MKAHVKNIISGAVLGLTLLAHTGPTWAGLAVNPEVVVTATSAAGAVQAARFSSDSRQSIGCVVRKSGAAVAISCTAEAENGAALACGSYDPQLIAVAETMTSGSYISFSTLADTATCDLILVNNASHYLR